MQTFITHSLNSMCARVLDDRRLNKQRVEAKQILIALSNPDYGWRNHPAVRMWKGRERWLASYGWHMCYEWKHIRRKRDDANLLGFFYSHVPREWFKFDYEFPAMGYSSSAHTDCILASEQLILSHRSNLIRKFPEHYRKFWPDVPDNLPYFWPYNVPIPKDYAYSPEQYTQKVLELRAV
jgi:hypothetical protein